MIKKFLKISKRLIALFVVILLNINSYAAVGANDGSAFVTKAEFDALVNTFNEQMDDYENNLVSKIDGAIANYLASQSSSQTFKRSIEISNAVKNGILSFNKKSPLDYVYGYPKIKGWYKRTDFPSSGTYVSNVTFKWNGANPTDVTKTVITNIKESSTSGASTAMWKGYMKSKDTISCIGNERNNAWSVNLGWSQQYQAVERSNCIKNQDLGGNESIIYSLRAVNSSGTEVNSGIMFSLKMYAVENDWNTTIEYPFISVVEPYDYDMFSNYDRNKNWGYDGNYMTKFAGVDNKITLSSGAKQNWDMGQKTMGTSVSISKHVKQKGNYQATTISATDTNAGFIKNSASGTFTIFVPMVGFERTYLTNWKQIYDGNTGSVADFEYEKHRSETGYSDRAILTDKDGHRYLGVQAGFPLIQVKQDEQLEYNLKFKDKSKNYIVWISKRPFKTTGHPDDDDNCLTDLIGLDKSKNATKGYTVVSGEGTFKTQVMNEDCILYLKWGINNTAKTDIAGGIFMPEPEGTIYVEE